MRKLVLLLGMLLVVPGLTAAEDLPAEPSQAAVNVTVNATALLMECLEQARSAGLDEGRAAVGCVGIFPECSFLVLTIHDEPFWVEPEPRVGCAFDWVTFVLRLLEI